MEFPADFPISIFEFLALFQVALSAVTVGQRHANAHESRGGQQQQKHAFVDRALPCFRARGNVARTHRAALAESRRRSAQAAKESQR